MQSPMSSASAPNPLGASIRGSAVPAPSRPEIVKPAPTKPRPSGLWWGLIALAIVAGVGVYWNRNQAEPEKGGGPTATAVRTATLAVGDLHRTVRLGGTVQAERFAGLLAPLLRGSRSSF